MSRNTIAVTLALLLAACGAGVHTRRHEEIKTTLTGHSYEEIWKAAVQAAGAHSDIVDSDQSLGIIQAERRSDAGSPGSSFHILISPPLAGAEAYRVEVVARKAGRAAQEWGRHVIRHIRDLLEGGSLEHGSWLHLLSPLAGFFFVAFPSTAPYASPSTPSCVG